MNAKEGAPHFKAPLKLEYHMMILLRFFFCASKKNPWHDMEMRIFSLFFSFVEKESTFLCYYWYYSKYFHPILISDTMIALNDTTSNYLIQMEFSKEWERKRKRKRRMGRKGGSDGPKEKKCENCCWMLPQCSNRGKPVTRTATVAATTMRNKKCIATDCSIWHSYKSCVT